MRCAIVSLLVLACSAETTTELPPSQVHVVQTSPTTVEIQLEGQRHLRGVQVTLDYDPAKVQLLHVDPGPDAQWLDTVRMGGPAGHTIVVISDTRQIELPKAGVLARVSFMGAGSISGSHVVQR